MLGQWNGCSEHQQWRLRSKLADHRLQPPAALVRMDVLVYIKHEPPYLSGKVGSSALGHLENDWCLLIPCGFERCDDGGGRCHVLEFGQS